jgi:hypothetical protein
MSSFGTLLQLASSFPWCLPSSQIRRPMIPVEYSTVKYKNKTKRDFTFPPYPFRSSFIFLSIGKKSHPTLPIWNYATHVGRL